MKPFFKSKGTMLKTGNKFGKSLAFVLAFQLGMTGPIPLPTQNRAHATETNNETRRVCGPINARQGANKDPNVPVAGYTDCMVAEQARKAKDQATVKSVIFGVLGGICTVLSIPPITAGSGPVCTALTTAASVLAMLYDSTLATKIQDESSATSQGIRDGVNSLVATFQAIRGASQGLSIFNNLGQNISSVFSGTPSESSSSDQGSCVVSAVVSFINMALAIWEATDAKKIQQIKTAAAETNANAAASSNAITSNFSNSSGSQQNIASVNGTSPASQAGNTDPCQSAQGNSYLSCVFQGTNAAPAIAALVEDRTVKTLIDRMSGGKTLGDIAKSFKGDPSGSSIGNHLAGAFGMPDSMRDAFSKKLQDFQSLVGSARGAQPGGVYASKGGAHQDSKSGDLDFKKLMDGFIKQMGIDEKNTGGAKENPNDLVSKKLDQLSPESIEANRDISLFVRVGHRYQKKAPSILESEP